ncbi:MAG: phage head closure protein [Sarcina sp.]
MELNNRISFYKKENLLDDNGYRITNKPNIEYKCWADINKYFSKLQFASINLDINKSLNIRIRYSKQINELLSDETVKDIEILFNNISYTIASVDPYRYPKEYIVIVAVAHE